MKKGFFNRFWQSAVVASMMAAPAALAQVTIYMLGDSTMQDWAAGYYPKQGQGQDFHYWFDSGLATVVNRGQGGMAAEGYYDMFWKNGCSSGNCIAGKVKAGDYVVIQFGINDVSKSTEDGYRTSMTNMIKETQAKGATPIIMTPIRRYWFVSRDSIYPSSRGYPGLTRQIANDLNVPLIDMFDEVRNYMLATGQQYTEQFVYNYASTTEYSNLGKSETDAVHLQMNGANAYGRIITEQMRAHKNAQVKKLGDYMAPMYQVDVKVSPAGSSEATSVGAYYPEGMTVMLKTIPKEGKKFLGWYDGNGNKVGANSKSNVISPYMHTFVMGKKSTLYTAVYEGGVPELYSGDGSAVKTFPTSTPKSMDNLPYTPTGFEEKIPEETEKLDKNFSKFFDACTPDSGNGWSQAEHAGFMGEGYYNLENTATSKAIYKMYFEKAGTVTFAVRYANGGTSDRFFNAYMDHDYVMSAPPTGWDAYDTTFINMSVPQGYVDLELRSMTADGAPNIDGFGFSTEGVCRVSEGNCPAALPEQPSDTTAKDSSATVLASPLKWSSVETADIRIFDLSGKLVAHRQMKVGETLLAQDLNEMVKTLGLYQVVIRKGSQIIKQTMVKK